MQKKTPITLTDIQQVIISLAKIQGFVKVGTNYLPEVLNLQCQGLVTSSPCNTNEEAPSCLIIRLTDTPGTYQTGKPSSS